MCNFWGFCGRSWDIFICFLLLTGGAVKEPSQVIVENTQREVVAV